MPRFAERIPNVTVTVGRDALLACVVDNLRGFKVSCKAQGVAKVSGSHYFILVKNLQEDFKSFLSFFLSS